jgi:16S rRNA (cytosine1402-N4)-methyltransferase
MNTLHCHQHQSVLLQAALEGLAIKAQGTYIDATFGRGGHSRSILSELNTNGCLLSIDRDPEAANEAALIQDARFRFYSRSFSSLFDISTEVDIRGKVDGVLFDLGVSSPQLDDPERGFSFLRDGPLDMRMNPDEGQSAAQWLRHVSEKDLALVLKEYGEERFSKRIACAIIEARATQEITRTHELAAIISAAIPRKEKHKHPATRSFQAIRIFVNRELEELQQALTQCMDVLAVGGRLVVISFHSLEDRIVKHFMRKEAAGKQLPRKMPVVESNEGKRLKIIAKPMKADKEEVKGNIRARSALLRVAEKIA